MALVAARVASPHFWGVAVASRAVHARAARPNARTIPDDGFTLGDFAQAALNEVQVQDLKPKPKQLKKKRQKKPDWLRVDALQKETEEAYQSMRSTVRDLKLSTVSTSVHRFSTHVGASDSSHTLWETSGETTDHSSKAL